MLTVREPAVAGSFYPADSAELRQLVLSQLQRAGEAAAIDGVPVAYIVPHAGLVYSGPVAAYAYKLMEKHPASKVIMCGPSHRVPFQGLSVYGGMVAWKTPLGGVVCHDSLCSQVRMLGKHVTTDGRVQEKEHSLEVQLPFLQTVLKRVEIVPVMMGSQDKETIDELAGILSKLPWDDQTVMIAASDWQHYRPAEAGDRMDSIGVACLERMNPDELLAHLQDGSVEACGGGPVVAVMKAAIAHGADKIKILRVANSGDESGDKSSVVGYVAAVLYRSNSKEAKGGSLTGKQDMNAKEPEYLSADDKRRLLQIARESIVTHLRGKTVGEFDVSGTLKENGAAFVTLTENGRLRGCIGMTEARMPLYQTVSHCAISAAVEDPRFEPVTADEVAKLEIEISVLTPLTPVRDLDSIQVGRDGLMIRQGGHAGLLLPQVATEYGWNRTEFLRHTCEKAGLPADAYLRPDAVILRFQALIFDEAEFKNPGH